MSIVGIFCMRAMVRQSTQVCQSQSGGEFETVTLASIRVARVALIERKHFDRLSFTFSTPSKCLVLVAVVLSIAKTSVYDSNVRPMHHEFWFLHGCSKVG